MNKLLAVMGGLALGGGRAVVNGQMEPRNFVGAAPLVYPRRERSRRRQILLDKMALLADVRPELNRKQRKKLATFGQL